jgi:hypothetical protein
MTLQAALDKVFQAIRSDDEKDGEEARLSARLTDAMSVNDTFIAAATRVVNGDPEGEAVDLLTEAREVRGRADASIAAAGQTPVSPMAIPRRRCRNSQSQPN